MRVREIRVNQIRVNQGLGVFKKGILAHKIWFSKTGSARPEVVKSKMKSLPMQQEKSKYFQKGYFRKFPENIFCWVG